MRLTQNQDERAKANLVNNALAQVAQETRMA